MIWYMYDDLVATEPTGDWDWLLVIYCTVCKFLPL